MTMRPNFRRALLLLGFLTAPLHAKVGITKSDLGTEYRFEIEQVTLDPAETIEGEAYVQVRLGGIAGYEGLVAEEGKPEIPAIRFFVDGEGPIQIYEGPVDRIWGRGALKVRPFQPSEAKRPGAAAPPVIDWATYKSSELFPKLPYSVEKVGTVNGRLRRLVSLFPIRYLADENRFETIRKFQVHLDPMQFPLAKKGPKTLAVVLGASFSASAALSEYLAFKKTQGYEIARLEFGKDGKTSAEIRDALRALYAKSNLVEAMIVGDNADVPGYATTLIAGVTDHYYRCLDEADYSKDLGAPDIDVGRFSVHTEAELAAVVSKQLRYERGAFTDKSWISKFSFIATDDESHYQVAEASFDYLTDRYTAPLGYLGTFPNLIQLGGDLLYAIRHKATSAQVLDRLKEGRGFINYGGHGGPDSWLGPEITAADVATIQHPEATPFVMSNSCDTGKFIGNSFAEAWLRHPNGAVAYWGSMDSTYWNEDDRLQRRIYDMMFKEGDVRLGDFTTAGLSEVWRYYGGRNRSSYYWETYIVFGDPSLQVRLKP